VTVAQSQPGALLRLAGVVGHHRGLGWPPSAIDATCGAEVGLKGRLQLGQQDQQPSDGEQDRQDQPDDLVEIIHGLPSRKELRAALSRPQRNLAEQQ
jgi:hypothetical protein